MTSVHSKAKPSKNDSLYNSSRISTTNVNSLRKLFENNFKLSNITNAFRSKSQKINNAKKVTFDKSAHADWFTDDRIERSAECKENQRYVANTNDSVSKYSQNIASPPVSGNLLDCKIDNCCCKTFFREYSDTPTFRYRHLPKTPLRERSGAEFNRAGQPNATSTAIAACRAWSRECNNSGASSEREIRNKVMTINYEFYKSKCKRVDAEVSPVVERSQRSKAREGGESLVEKSDGVDGGDANASSKRRFEFSSERRFLGRKEAYGFVNFTATSMSEGGYMKLENERDAAADGVESGLPTRRRAGRSPSVVPKHSELEDTEVHKIGNFSFKYRVPKIKNIAVREHSYPYTLKKPRLTVKSVKNRNMRNVKRRQKLVDANPSLARSRTFNGYDNFAYRRSVTELQSPEREEADDTGEAAPQPNRDVSCAQPDLPREFRVDNRMTGYDWPVTSFYIQKEAPEERECSRSNNDVRYASSCDLSSRPESSRLVTIVRKSNLKRHCSLGYLEEEELGFNLIRHRRSLDNINRKWAL